MAKEIIHTDYNELKRVAETYYNDYSMCTVVALAVVAKVGYGKAYHALKRQGRQTRRGTHRGQQSRALFKLGFKLERFTDYTSKTLATMAKEASQLPGQYYVYTSRHVTALSDGKMIDWAAESSSRKRIQQVFKVVPITA